MMSPSARCDPDQTKSQKDAAAPSPQKLFNQSKTLFQLKGCDFLPEVFGVECVAGLGFNQPGIADRPGAALQKCPHPAIQPLSPETGAA